MNIVVRNNISSKLKILLTKSATILIQTVRHKQEKRNRMTNLLQENKKMESPRSNCTFGFFPTHKKPTRKNQKSNFISNAHRLKVSLRIDY